MYKRPYLQKYAGKTTRFTCPKCKTPFSFTRYLDGETHQPIHPTVDRCNREIKCGYHYTPRQYFADLKRQESHSPITNHPVPSHPDLHSQISNNMAEFIRNPTPSHKFKRHSPLQIKKNLTPIFLNVINRCPWSPSKMLRITKINQPIPIPNVLTRNQMHFFL
ncbi:MAG: PG0870-related protein [Proteiniphilum sp.]|jgi:hypothetical protein|nr:PG0870-related protein [Proteiniphilum sp.]